MTQDVEGVQSDVVSEETTPPEAEVQPLTEARIKEIIAQATEEGKREIQSVKDKARAEIEAALGRATLAEDTLAGFETGLKEIDPDATELAKYKARDRAHQAREAQERQRQQGATFRKAFYESETQSIIDFGVDPNDKRIDWGEDAPDPIVARRRISASVALIHKETAKGAEDKLTQRQQEFEAKTRKDLGLDSVDTSASVGVGGSDAEFQRDFASGKLPYTKANAERANKIMNK